MESYENVETIASLLSDEETSGDAGTAAAHATGKWILEASKESGAIIHLFSKFHVRYQLARKREVYSSDHSFIQVDFPIGSHLPSPIIFKSLLSSLDWLSVDQSTIQVNLVHWKKTN